MLPPSTPLWQRPAAKAIAAWLAPHVAVLALTVGGFVGVDLDVDASVLERVVFGTISSLLVYITRNKPKA